MAIDVFHETVLTFSQAAKRLPRVHGARRISNATIGRWARAGLKAADGTIVRLEAVRLGGTACTSLEAMQRFFNRLQSQSSHSEQTTSYVGQQGVQGQSRAPQSPRDREERIRRAERGLRLHGLCGDYHIFKNSTASSEFLCDLQEVLHKWMPEIAAVKSKAFLAVRNGIFIHAVEILEGKHAGKRSLQAAQEWISKLDLSTYDVRQLHGIGPLYSKEWTELREVPEIKALFVSQRRRLTPDDGSV